MNIGQLFMFGFAGLKPTEEILDFIRDGHLGGVILFRRNISSADQLKNLTEKLQDAAGGRLLIGIDQEGGRVANLPKSIMDIPPMEKLGRDYLNGKNTQDARDLGRELGRVLKGLGINLDFAPVLDVRTNRNNSVIGNRSFSEDPDVVATLGCELIRGMGEAGIIPCGKHFPGHGDTDEDSHKVLPHLRLGKERLESVELRPFRAAIDKGVPSLMSAHVVYDSIDPENPATLSKKILTDILRYELGFKGLLFSDDLEMKAISDNYALGEAAVAAIGAGCDILLICHSVARQRQAIEAVAEAVRSGDIPPTRLEAAFRRIQKLKSW